MHYSFFVKQVLHISRIKCNFCRNDNLDEHINFEQKYKMNEYINLEHEFRYIPDYKLRKCFEFVNQPGK